MDMNLNQYKQNINHTPKIYFEEFTFKNDQGKEIPGEHKFLLIIELNVPAPFYEESQKFIKIMSPLRLENDLLNYWNLKQVIVMVGQKQTGFDLAEYCKALEDQELIQSFSDKIPENFDYSLFYRHNESEISSKQGKMIEDMMEAHRGVRQIGRDFDQAIQHLAMPLRMSLMVPISNGRIQVFEKQIIDLINYFIGQGYTTEKQRELQME